MSMSLRSRVLEQLLPHPIDGQRVRFDGHRHTIIEDSSRSAKETDCPICWNEIGTQSSFHCVCRQVYHYSCIKSWIEHGDHNECPTCRRTLWDPTQYCAILERLECSQQEQQDEYKNRMLNEAQSHEELGLIYQEQEKFEEACAHFNRVTVIYEQIVPESILLSDSYVDLGIALFDRRNYQQACALYRKAIPIFVRHDPQSTTLADVYYNLSLALASQQKVEESMTELEKAVSIYEKNPVCEDQHKHLASCYNRLGQYYEEHENGNDRAIECFEKAIKFQESVFQESVSESLDFARNLLSLGLLYQPDNPDRGFECYQKVMEKLEHGNKESIELTSCYYHLACASTEKGEHAEALRFFQKALDRYTPGSEGALDTLCHLAICHEKMQDYCMASMTYEKALALYDKRNSTSTDEARCANNLGRIRMEYGDLDESIGLLERAVVLWSSSNDDLQYLGHYNLGIAKVFRGDYLEAVKACQLSEDTLRRNSDSSLLAVPIIVHIRVLTILGEIDKAQSLVKRALQASVSFTPDQVGELNLCIGLLHAERQEWQKSEESVRKGVRLYAGAIPGSFYHASAKVCLASVLLARNKTEEALSCANDALEMLPSRPFYRTITAFVVLGEIYTRMADLENGMFFFNQASIVLMEKAPRSVEMARVYCGFAEILSQQGNIQLAQEKWGKALVILNTSGASCSRLARIVNERMS